MQYPIDVCELVEGVTAFPEDERVAFAPVLEAVLSKRDVPWKLKASEFASLCHLTKAYRTHGGDDSDLTGFAYSYKIPHVSKEVDLLKVTETMVLDVELKSQDVAEASICRQLERNTYYLSFIGLPVMALTYVGKDEGTWYAYENGRINPIGWEEAVARIQGVGAGRVVDLDTLFNPGSYLVSPVQNFDRFSRGEYVLSDQQEVIKRQVLAYLGQEHTGGLVVSGDAGTGKSLLLYDIAKTYARGIGKRAAIFHGAQLSEAHDAFNARCEEIRVLHPLSLGDINPCEYSFVGFDEAHRMYPGQFRQQLTRAVTTDTPFVVSLDPKQEMSKLEVKSDIYSVAREMVPKERTFVLSKRFRANDQIVGFVEGLVRGKGTGPRCTDRVSVVFAADEVRAREQVRRFQRKGYNYIWTTKSKYRPSALDDLVFEGAPSTHEVIGLEFDKVVMVASLVYLKKGRLHDLDHPDPNLLPTRVLYQGLTRAREAIALVVLGDRNVFRRAISLLGKGA